jgi:hypothetical protein
MLTAIILGTRSERLLAKEPSAPYVHELALLAAGLTALHWYMVDTRWSHEYPARTLHETWQRSLYLNVLNGVIVDTAGDSQAPHVYRMLPYGFTRSLERVTRDWQFSCLAYRWFFLFWFLWFSCAFVARFHGPRAIWFCLAVTTLLYPLSILFYWGQLTDPLSHALFVLSLIYVVEDNWLPLLMALALGIGAKETAVVLVPAYGLCYWRQGLRALGKTALLGVTCVAAFLATRLPLGWAPGLGQLNGTEGLMIGTNLGIGQPLYRGAAPTWQNYLQPFLFIGVFVPWIVARWPQIDRRLRVLCCTLPPLVLLSSLCFSWLYESRNYMPLLPILVSAAWGKRHG